MALLGLFVTVGVKFWVKTPCQHGQLIARWLLCVRPANASALRTSRISCQLTLSHNSGSWVASAGAPFAGASGYTIIKYPTEEMEKLNTSQLECRRQSTECPQDCGVRDGMGRRRNDEYHDWPSQCHERKGVPQNCVRRIRKEEPPLFRARLALIRSAQSPPRVAP